MPDLMLAASQAQPQPGSTDNGNGNNSGGSGNFLGIGPGGWTDPTHWPIIGPVVSQPAPLIPVPTPWQPIPGGPNVAPQLGSLGGAALSTWWGSLDVGSRRAIVIGIIALAFVLVLALRR